MARVDQCPGEAFMSFVFQPLKRGGGSHAPIDLTGPGS